VINRNNNSEIGIFYTLISCAGTHLLTHLLTLPSLTHSFHLFAAALRSVWFLIPSENLEGGYIPTSEIAYRTSNWFGVLISEILLSAGRNNLLFHLLTYSFALIRQYIHLCHFCVVIGILENKNQ